VGSNAFNLAAMIGVSGLLAGSVRLSRETVLFEGLVGAAITLIAAAILLRWLSPPVGAALLACLLVPYLAVVVGGRGALGGQPPAPEPAGEISTDPTHHLLGLIVLDVGLIVAGSAGMVESALALGDHWHVSRAVLGVLVLAPLTSLPNAITGVRLGVAGRGAALVSETLNSNTINLGAGVIAPALFITVAALSATAKLQLAWLIGMTLATLVLLARPGGMRRGSAAVLIGLYFGFAALQLVK
jgi:Ca2+/Na+ antiporter